MYYRLSKERHSPLESPTPGSLLPSFPTLFPPTAYLPRQSHIVYCPFHYHTSYLSFSLLLLSLFLYIPLFIIFFSFFFFSVYLHSVPFWSKISPRFFTVSSRESQFPPPNQHDSSIPLCIYEASPKLLVHYWQLFSYFLPASIGNTINVHYKFALHLS